MRASTLGLILLSVTLSALAQVSFKYGMSAAGARSPAPEGARLLTFITALASPGVLGGLALYGLGTLLWLQVLSRTDLSQAYPFVGLGFILTALMGLFLFGETVTMMRAAGIVLVIIGIYLVARS